MESDDDEKRRVMTPPESWGGGPQNQPGKDDDLLGDDSWLSDDADIPAEDAGETAGAPETGPASSPEEPAPDEPEATAPEDDDWLGSAPDLTAAPEPATAPESDATSSAAETPAAEEPAEPALGSAEPGPAPEAAPTTENSDLEDSPTASISAAAAQLMDEELTQEASESNSAEALLTDHKAVSTPTAERKVPTWAFAALAVALLLIIGGGWGFFSERGKLEAQIDALEKELQAVKRLKEGDLSTEEEEVLIADNQSLRLQMATQREQYAAMASELDQLQAMIDQAQGISGIESAGAEPDPAEATPSADTRTVAQQEAATPAAPRETLAAAQTTQPAANSAPATQVTATGGDWFVNVASYSRRDIAQEWADKLAADIDDVVLQEVTVNGKPLFRVRAVGYPDKAAAQTVANRLEQQYGIGPLWVGKEAAGAAGADRAASSPTPSTAPAASAAGGNEMAAVSAGSKAGSTRTGGWFIVVDTYSQGVDADAQARKIRDAGYDAKVAVESRAGELFYRVQVVGIESERQGEETVRALAQLGDLPNLQLRRY